MNRIKKTFNQGPVYAGFITAGDGGIERSFEAAMALIDGGVNLLEIGLPFSDPVADGPVIQAASERALASGTSCHDVLVLAEKIRAKTEIPLVLFSYYNPILSALGKDFLQQAKAAGVDGLLIVDLPLEEAQQYRKACIAAGLDPVFLIAPNTPSERIKKIAAAGRGFLYYVCRKGTTGMKHQLPEDFAVSMAKVKSCAKLPILAGFGITNREMAQQVLNFADGFVVGSAFVNAIAEGYSSQALTQLAKSINPNEVSR